MSRRILIAIWVAAQWLGAAAVIAAVGR